MLAEFFGTFVLLLLGLGTCAVNVVGLPESGRQTLPFGPDNWLITVFGWAFAVMLAAYVSGGISGAHFNPAVTLAFAVARKFAWRNVIPYWAAQLAGAFCASAAVYAVYRAAILAHDAHTPRSQAADTFGIFATSPAPYFHGGYLGPVVDQLVGTAILVVLIAALIDNRNQAPSGNLAPLLIGFVVAVIGCAYGTNAGYALNPARDLGPRIFTWLEGWGSSRYPGITGRPPTTGGFRCSCPCWVPWSASWSTTSSSAMCSTPAPRCCSRRSRVSLRYPPPTPQRAWPAR